MKITIENLKKLSRDKKVLEAAEMVFLAMDRVKELKDQIEPKQYEIIKKHQFKPDSSWGELAGSVIESPDLMYLSSDKDFDLYINEMDKIHKELGFEKESKDHCPLHSAKEALRASENMLVSLTTDYTGIDVHSLLCSKNGLQNLRNYIDIILDMLIEMLKPNVKIS